MKTNQIITRKIGELDLAQRTKDGMFNATAFIKEFNLDTQNSGYVKKDLDDYFQNASSKDFIEEIKEREGVEDCMVVNKSRARADRGGGTWMHPMLFLDFAMWLNPKFKYDVIKFVQDQLIAFRNEAGDAYKQLSGAVAKLSNKDTMQDNIRTIAKAVNCVTYGYHEAELRNKIGDEAKMKQLMELERHIAQLVSEGFITKFNDEADAEHSLIAYLREQWKKRWADNPIDKLIS